MKDTEFPYWYKIALLGGGGIMVVGFMIAALIAGIMQIVEANPTPTAVIPSISTVRILEAPEFTLHLGGVPAPVEWYSAAGAPCIALVDVWDFSIAFDDSEGKTWTLNTLSGELYHVETTEYVAHLYSGIMRYDQTVEVSGGSAKPFFVNKKGGTTNIGCLKS